jgi:hypothetical protein
VKHIFIFVYILSPSFRLRSNLFVLPTLTTFITNSADVTITTTVAGTENRRQLLFAFRPHSV